MNKLLYIAMLALTLTACGGDDDSTPEPTTPQTPETPATPTEQPDVTPTNEAVTMARTLGFGWNLGNHFDSYRTLDDGTAVRFPAEWGSWWDGATPTETLYARLAQAGVKTVRIPVTWGVWQGAQPDYTIDASYLALVKQNVAWAHKYNLNVVLNTHHDTKDWLDIEAAVASVARNNEILARITATWRQIAEAFASEGDYLIFETFNEITAEDDWGYGASTRDGGRRYGIINQWNQQAVDAIRATGGQNASRWIAVVGLAQSPAATLTGLTLPTDAASRIMVAVHCYDPYALTLSNDLGGSFSSSDQQALTSLFARLKSTYIDKGIPCYIGEMGCTKYPTAAGESVRARYMQFFSSAAYAANLPIILWDNMATGTGGDSAGEHHAYFDHNDGSWLEGHESLVKSMINEE